jgi:hypothetical protein
LAFSSHLIENIRNDAMKKRNDGLFFLSGYQTGAQPMETGPKTTLRPSHRIGTLLGEAPYTAVKQETGEI